MTTNQRATKKDVARLLNRMFSAYIVGLRGKRCALAGKHTCSGGVQVAHLLGKGAHPHWRWEEWNALPLCSAAHDALDGRNMALKKEVSDLIAKTFPVMWETTVQKARERYEPWTVQELLDKAANMKLAMDSAAQKARWQ